MKKGLKYHKNFNFYWFLTFDLQIIIELGRIIFFKYFWLTSKGEMLLEDGDNLGEWIPGKNFFIFEFFGIFRKFGPPNFFIKKYKLVSNSV